MVGHNPGFTALVNYFSDKTLENLPTAGLYGIQFSVSRWSGISENGGKEILHEYPKKHRSK
jgi:phosphohistidine phosphatase